jgi:putative ABC transport system ATP-binding protein/lipoprotein-releasing system ATP-binding protein
MIQLNSLSKTYTPSNAPAVEAVRSVSLNIQPGEFVVITGRSGSGKTTLLNLAAGLTRPTQGQVLYNETDLWSLPDTSQAKLRSQQIGFVFQFPSLLPSLTALENVALPVIFTPQKKQPNKETIDRAAGLLHTVGLSDKKNARPRQLSAGQQQRVVIARALMNQPQFLFADEPTSDLDEQTELEIMDLFQKIHQETHLTILMVTHSNQLVSYGTRAIEMAAGQVIKGG